MRITVGRLRQLFAEAMASEAKITASDEYMKKEAVREHIQKHVVDLVAAGEIKSQEELDAFWATTDMAVKALKGIPLEVWTKLSGRAA